MAKRVQMKPMPPPYLATPTLVEPVLQIHAVYAVKQFAIGWGMFRGLVYKHEVGSVFNHRLECEVQRGGTLFDIYL